MKLRRISPIEALDMVRELRAMAELRRWKDPAADPDRLRKAIKSARDRIRSHLPVDK